VYLLDFFQVMDYEAEQQRLLRLFEEVPTDIEYDDEEDSSEEDYVEERLEKSETEQELDSEEEVEEQNENVSKRAKWMRDTYYLGKYKETK
jgi:histone acetyltransferase (RNA polymerase elongator complex component)